ncbi:MAG: exodeoxyribonuclease III [Flavobacteriales bacterium]
MKIITYNVNGLRSALSKNWLDWLKAVNPDVVCLQEIKSTADQLELSLFHDLGYETYLFPAQKKGYSGVALFSKTKPNHVEIGIGMDVYDSEGRILRADFGDVSVMSAYFPSGSSGEERQGFKFKFLDDFQGYVNDLKREKSSLIICGDYNICHRPIDIHNPVSNAKSSGFLPEERAWMESFFQSGFVDTFRHFNPDPHHYTWWSYRANARAKNLGWRIDYIAASENLKENIKRSIILPDAKHSDHCPVLTEFAFS